MAGDETEEEIAVTARNRTKSPTEEIAVIAVIGLGSQMFFDESALE